MAAQQGSSPPRTVQGVFAQNRNEQVENKNWEGLALRQSKSQKALSSEEMKAEVSKMQESETTALTSDLAEWLSRVLKKDITAENLFDQLENGVLLCELSQIVTPGKGVSAPRPDAKRGMWATSTLCLAITHAAHFGGYLPSHTIFASGIEKPQLIFGSVQLILFCFLQAPSMFVTTWPNS